MEGRMLRRTHGRLLRLHSLTQSPEVCAFGGKGFCIAEVNTNLRAVLALLLYVRERHPPFRGHGAQHGSTSPGDAARDGGGGRGQLGLFTTKEVWAQSADGPRTARSRPAGRNSETVTRSEPRK